MDMKFFWYGWLEALLLLKHALRGKINSKYAAIMQIFFFISCSPFSIRYATTGILA